MGKKYIGAIYYPQLLLACTCPHILQTSCILSDKIPFRALVKKSNPSLNLDEGEEVSTFFLYAANSEFPRSMNTLSYPEN